MCPGWGGEEFIAALLDQSEDGLEEICERCKSTIEGLNIPHEDSLISERITVSIGAAWVVPDEDEKGRKLIQAADECLYEAKENGRNRFYIKDLHSRAVEYPA
ncbi:GGDEF domain-containing protein [Rossellomorea sp. AcN35-11]|nr:GGDEF domain-containing protein [Rossellomorea sp. AcN35-11]